MTTLSSSSVSSQSIQDRQQQQDDYNNNETTTNNNNNDKQIQLLIQFSIMFIFVVVLQIILGRFFIIISKENKRRLGHMGTGLFFIYYFYIPNLPLYISIIAILFTCYTIYYWFYYCPSIYMFILGPFLRVNELPHSIVTKLKIHEQKTDTTNQLQHSQNQNQQQQLPGAFWFLLAIAILLTFFPPITCQYCVLCLSICDPLAAFIGQLLPSSKVSTVLLSLVHTTSSIDHNTKKISTTKIQQQQQQQQQQTIYNNIIKIIQSSNASISGSVACFISSWIIGYMSLVMPVNSSLNYFYFQITIGAIACTFSEAYPILNDNISIPIVTAITITILS